MFDEPATRLVVCVVLAVFAWLVVWWQTVREPPGRRVDLRVLILFAVLFTGLSAFYAVIVLVD